MNNINKFGSIHGRFQPFHNAHLVYALSALRHVEKIYIGLTKILTEEAIGNDVAPHRFKAEENPLTYYQRSVIISRVLLNSGIPQERFDVGPFPIEVPSRLSEFWPIYAPCFTTQVADWNRRKIEILNEIGYKAIVLDLSLDGVKVTSGTEIRKLFRAGDMAWKQYVPAATAACIEENSWKL
jgi:nicotinamide mononucleotide adenylyltransferase